MQQKGVDVGEWAHRQRSNAGKKGGGANNVAAQRLAAQANLRRQNGTALGSVLNWLGGAKAVVRSGASSEQVRLDLQEAARDAGKTGGSKTSLPQQIQGVVNAFSRARVKPIRTLHKPGHARPYFQLSGTNYTMNISPFQGALEMFVSGKYRQRRDAMKAYLQMIEVPKPGPRRGKSRGALADKAAEVGAKAQQIADNGLLTVEQRGVLFWLWADMLRGDHNAAVRVAAKRNGAVGRNGGQQWTNTDDMIGHFLTQPDEFKKRKRDEDGDQGGDGGSNSAPVRV